MKNNTLKSEINLIPQWIESFHSSSKALRKIGYIVCLGCFALATGIVYYNTFPSLLVLGIFLTGGAIFCLEPCGMHFGRVGFAYLPRMVWILREVKNDTTLLPLVQKHLKYEEICLAPFFGLFKYYFSLLLPIFTGLTILLIAMGKVEPNQTEDASLWLVGIAGIINVISALLSAKLKRNKSLKINPRPA